MFGLVAMYPSTKTTELSPVCGAEADARRPLMYGHLCISVCTGRNAPGLCSSIDGGDLVWALILRWGIRIASGVGGKGVRVHGTG